MTEAQKKSAELLKQAGWQNVEDFVRAPFASPYGAGGFPVKIEPVVRVDDFIAFDVEAANRLDDWLTVGIDLRSPSELPAGDCRINILHQFVHNWIVPSRSRKTVRMIVYAPRSERIDEQTVRAEVNLESNSTNVYNVVRFLDVSAVPIRSANTKEHKTLQNACSAPTGG